jgi:hypothetical protein
MRAAVAQGAGCESGNRERASGLVVPQVGDRGCLARKEIAVRSAVFSGRTPCLLHGFVPIGLRLPAVDSKPTVHREVSPIRFKLCYLDIGWCSFCSIGELGVATTHRALK